MRHRLRQLVHHSRGVRCSGALVVLAVLGSCGASPKRVAGPDPALTCRERLVRGKDLECKKDYAAALKVYEPCLVDLLPRLSILAREYPPARDFLRVEHGRAASGLAREIGRGIPPQADRVALYLALNDALGQPELSLKLYDEVASSPSLESTAHDVHLLVWGLLVEAGRYSDALRWEVPVRDSVMASIAMARQERATGSVEMTEVARKSAAQYAEALLAIDRADDAWQVADDLLRSDTEAASFSAFIQSAARAGHADFAARLRERAGKDLVPADTAKVDRAFTEAFRRDAADGSLR
jgi:hypothetical protein